MRKVISALLALTMILSIVPLNVFAEEKTAFSDVKTTDYYATAATALSELDIIEGYTDGTFGAEKGITRAEVAAIACRMIDKSKDAETAKDQTKFDDVAIGYWASGYINVAAQENIINGDGDGNFRPEDDITYEEAIKIIVCVLGLGKGVKVDPADWSAGYLAVAKDKGLTKDLKGKKGDVATRGDVAVMTYNGMTFDLKAPVASLEAGSYTGTKSVTLKTETEGAEIYYTTDGSAPTVKSTKYTKAISISKTTTLKAIAVKKGVLTSDVMSVEYTIKSSGGGGSRGGGSSSSSTYTVTFDLNYEGANDTIEKQILKSGDFVLVPDNPQRPGYQFVGWYVTKDEKNWENAFDFENTNITSNITLYALWVDITKDSDQDGLADEVEAYLKTDKEKVDTDTDGLTDYQEVMQLGTDPLKQDTDDNGVSDFDEDLDGDELSNGQEFSIGTDPTNDDTDNDLLNDFSEANNHHTSPISIDTDNDGATDNWEIENNFDPKVYNETFAIKESSENISEGNPVSATVETMLSGNQVDSLDVTPVSDNPLVTASIAGYLGTAYDFTVDGDINFAKLTFEYDTSLGSIGEDFQPRIYYLDETTQQFVELKDQIVTDGKVVANTNHFSTYILLNKVDFESVWHSEIEPPFTNDDGSEATLNIAFVVDYSASMDDNDPSKLFKFLSKEFVSKLRDDKDSATIIKFIRRATLVSELTTNKEKLNEALDSIYYDDGYGTYSGTDGSTGYKMALDELDKTDSQYKYIILITDGEDNGYAYDYNELIERSVISNVVVYTVGMGSASENILKKIAQGTNGKYYHATTGSASDDIVDLNKVFDDIQGSTVEKTADTNKDGIPDYYNDLIKNGDLILRNGSEEFSNIDFNYNKDGKLSADYDGDGLSNGKELALKVDEATNQVYMEMFSDPMIKDTDGDGFSDNKKYHEGTNPLVHDYDGVIPGLLLSSDSYYYHLIPELYDNDAVFRIEQGIFGFGLTDGFEKSARKQIINYLYDYANDDFIIDQTNKYVRIAVVDSLNDTYSKILKYVKNAKKAADTADKVYEHVSEAAKYQKGIKQIMDRTNDIIASNNGDIANKQLLSLINKDYVQILQKSNQLDSSISGQIDLAISGVHNKYKSFLDCESGNLTVGKKISYTLKAVSFGLDVAETINNFSKINANTAAFENNFDILRDLKNNAKYSEIRSAATSVINAMGKGCSSYNDEIIKAIFLEDGVELVVKEIVKENPIAKGYETAMTILKIMGADKTVKAVYKVLCYDQMIKAVIRLSKDELTRYSGDTYYYYCESGDNKIANRYLTHLCQLQVLADIAYLEIADRKKNSNADFARDELRSTVKLVELWEFPVSRNLQSAIKDAKL